MTNRAAASRYARALFDVAVKQHADLEGIERDLADFVALFTAHPALRDVMLNPAVPAPRKRAAMEDLTRQSGVSPFVARLLMMLADRDRLVLLPDLLNSYRDRLMDHRNVIRAEITTAVPLSSDRTAQIEQRLASLTGRRVTMTMRTDPGIIGGIVARLGGVVYDGSVATQLNKLKNTLAKGA